MSKVNDKLCVRSSTDHDTGIDQVPAARELPRSIDGAESIIIEFKPSQIIDYPLANQLVGTTVLPRPQQTRRNQLVWKRCQYLQIVSAPV